MGKQIPWNKGTKGLQIPWNKGKKYEQISGQKHWNWRGGKSNLWCYKQANKLPKICVICRTTERLEIHHKDGNRGNNELNNIEWRCRKHHEKAHKHKKTRGSWKKGHIPWCKGTKGILKPTKGCFQKGNIPWWKKQGYKSAREAIISKRGYFKK